MSITVRVPTQLRTLTGGQEAISVEGNSVASVIENLEKGYPGLRERLLDKNGAVQRFVNLYVGDEDVRFLDGLETELKDGDEISIVPAIAGG